jgi:hypothetical protein
MNTATMNDCIMTDVTTVTNYSFCLLIGAMDDRPILNVYKISDPDAVNVTTNYSIEPNAAFFSDNHIANNGRIFRKKT